MKLYKLIDSAKKLTFLDFLEEAEEFLHKVCIYDSCEREWPDEYTLNDIIRLTGHNHWIYFKRSLEANNKYLLELVISHDSNNVRVNKTIRLIIKSYIKIKEFIISQFPVEDFIEQCYNGTIEGQWNRVDIAFELIGVITTIILKIREIDPLLLDGLESTVGNNVSQPSSLSSDVVDERLIQILEKLLSQEYVLPSQDGNKYEWIKSAGLYGFFVDAVTDYLKMRPDSNRIPWGIFKNIFSNHDKIINTARDRVSKYNNDILPKPDGFEIINDIVTGS